MVTKAQTYTLEYKDGRKFENLDLFKLAFLVGIGENHRVPISELTGEKTKIELHFCKATITINR